MPSISFILTLSLCFCFYTVCIDIYYKCQSIFYLFCFKQDSFHLVNTSIISHFFLRRTFEFHSLSRVQLYNTVSLTKVIMLDITSSDLTDFLAETLYSFTNRFLFPALPSPSQPTTFILFLWVCLFNRPLKKCGKKNNIKFAFVTTLKCIIP